MALSVPLNVYIITQQKYKTILSFSSDIEIWAQIGPATVLGGDTFLCSTC